MFLALFLPILMISPKILFSIHRLSTAATATDSGSVGIEAQNNKKLKPKGIARNIKNAEICEFVVEFMNTLIGCGGNGLSWENSGELVLEALK